MERKTIETSEAPAPIGPYSQAIMAGQMLFVSGQIAMDASSGKLVNGDIRQETRQVMKNIGAILRQAGMVFSDIVKCSIFVKDMNDFGAVNEVYGEYFKEHAPARETVEVSRLPKDVHVEISCIAGQ